MTPDRTRVLVAVARWLASRKDRGHVTDHDRAEALDMVGWLESHGVELTAEQTAPVEASMQAPYRPSLHVVVSEESR